MFRDAIEAFSKGLPLSSDNEGPSVGVDGSVSVACLSSILNLFLAFLDRGAGLLGIGVVSVGLVGGLSLEALLKKKLPRLSRTDS